ncbi:MAG: hypothetical protein V2J02_12450 [Pseudomonadales bacterium]|jgi:hypothetical protein|nr:hypothetical protein [Pseudomonadales bacterium]
MSAPGTRYRCSGCNYETDHWIEPTVVTYVADDGDEIEGQFTLGWCKACGQLQQFEDLGSFTADAIVEIEEEALGLREELEALESGFMARLRRRARIRAVRRDLDWTETKLEQARKLGRLIASRAAGPRCLECGEARERELLERGPGAVSLMEHECGGILEAVGDDEAGLDLAFDLRQLRLDSEGRPARDASSDP